MPDSRRSYSTIQLAETLGVSVQTVQRWVDAGHIRAWKTVGGHRKIDADSADAWVSVMQAEAGLPALQGEGAKGPVRALLADDDAAFLEVVAALVADLLPAAVIEVAGNGFHALQSMARCMPDLLATDVVMSHVDGLEMLRHVVAQPVRPSLVVVASALSLSELQRRGGLPPGVEFLPKPLDQQAFAGLIRSRMAVN